MKNEESDEEAQGRVMAERDALAREVTRLRSAAETCERIHPGAPCNSIFRRLETDALRALASAEGSPS